ncbi:MAG: DUF2059 domain-containing protein [Terriglobales bacterium]
MKNKVLMMVAAIALCVPQALAQAPQASRESVMNFFTATHIADQVQQVQGLMMDEMAKSLRAMLDNDTRLSTEDKDQVMDLMAPEMQGAATVYPISEMLDDMLPVYQKHFTDSDMQAITTFFESPVGKKFISENGPMMKEAMAVIMPKLSTRMQAQMADMQKRMVERLKQKQAEKKQ